MLGNNSEPPRLSDNQRLLLDLLRRHQPIARADVTDLTELTQQSIHRLIEGLIGDGLVATQRGKPNGRGKPSPRLSLASSSVHAAGFVVSADRVVLTVADLSCNAISQKKLDLDLSNPGRAVRQMGQALAETLDQLEISRRALCGIGFAMAGAFVQQGCTFGMPSPLGAWSLMDIGAELRAEFNKPVFIENDATASAIAESLVGVGKRYKTFALIAFNYGLGGGLIIDGKPYFGHFGNAGELSRIFHSSEVESRPALRYLLKELQQQGSSLKSVDELCENFDPEWPGVEQWVERVMPQLKRMVDTLTAILDPQAIVFGGQLPLALGEIFMDRLDRRAVLEYDRNSPLPEIVLSEAGCDSGAIGSALLPLKHIYFR